MSEMESTTAYRKHYVLGEWEGGIAVFVTRGDHGTKVVSIPRLGLCTALTGTYDDQTISAMLMKNRAMYNTPQEMDHFTDLIMRDIKSLPAETMKKRGKPA